MGSLRIARIAGIDIKLHSTFILVLLLGAWQFGHLGVRGALFGVLLMVLLFVSVTLHELGHSLVAKAFGLPVKDITLTPIGGIAQLGGRPKSPGQELLIAIAGPAVNVVLALGLGSLALWQFGLDALLLALQGARVQMPTVVTLWAMVISSNITLAVFNMLPALPMDGGRVFRAFLALAVGQERGTQWAAMVGRVFSVGFIVTGALTGNVTLLFIGVFIFTAAGAEVRAVQLDRALDGIVVRDAINPYAPRFLPATTLGEAMQALVYTPHSSFAVEHFGRLVGVVTRDKLITALNEVGPHAYIAEFMKRDVPTIQAGATLEQARQAMNAALSPFVAVLDADIFLGLLTEQELAQHATLAAQRRALGEAFVPLRRRWSPPRG